MLSLKKIATKVAAKDSSSFNFSHQHMTTLDFGINRPILCQEVVPHDELKFNMSSFARLAPLALPTVGSANIEARAFFIRNRDICNQWEDFISNKSSFYDGNGSFVAPFPTQVRPIDLVRLFIVKAEVASVANFIGDTDNFEASYGTLPDCLKDITYSVSADPNNYDVQFFMYVNQTDFSNGVRRLCYANFTPYGKSLYSFLSNLGYRLDFILSGFGRIPQNQIDYLSSTFGYTNSEIVDFANEANSHLVSALPLLAAVKVFVDYYRNPRYNTSISSILFDNYLSSFIFDNLVDVSVSIVSSWLDAAYDSYNNILDSGVVSAAFFIRHFGDMIYVLQSPDIYTSSWTSMNANGDASSLGELQIDGLPGNVEVLSEANSVHLTSASAVNLSNFALTAIQKLASFVRRNNVVGNRYVDQLLARFGVRPSDAVAGRSEYLGSWITPINISDVTATANGTAQVGGESVSSEVGDYNGKGVAFGNGKTISFKSDEHGFFIVFATIRPLVQYYQGALDHIYRTSLFDYFTPEFDAMNMEGIGKSSLYPDLIKLDVVRRDPNDSSLVSGYPVVSDLQGVFGYLPTYSSYKYRRDSLSGDFRIFRYRNSLDSFHLMRPVYLGDTNEQSFQVFDDSMREEYDRIFRDTSIDDEHFFCSFMFDLTMRRPMKSISESFVLDGDQGRDKVVTPPAGQRF